MKEKMNLRIIIISTLIFAISCTLFSQEDWFSKGQKAMSENQFGKAITYFTKEIEANEKNPVAYYMRGIANLYDDKTDKAIKDFNKALKLDPKNSDVFNSRGLAYSIIGKLDKAIDDFTNAIKFDSKNSQAYFNRGNIYLNEEKYEQAMHDYRLSINADSTNPAAFMQRGNAYYALNMIPEAIADFNKAITMGLKITKVFYNRGNAYFRAKDYKSAVEDYNKVINMDTNDVEAINNRAMAYDKLGDTLLAQNDRQRLANLYGTPDKYKSIDSLHFITYVIEGGDFSINMPDTWHKITHVTDDVKEMIIALDTISSFDSPYNVGIKLSINKNMYKNFKVKSVNELINFWKDSDDLNAKDYSDYRRLEETYFSRNNGYSGLQRTIQILVKKDMQPLCLYEYAVAKEDVMFYGYFQAPVYEWGYYKQIFDKAIKTLGIK